MSASLGILLGSFTLAALGLTLYLQRFIQLEIAREALDYPRYLKAVERHLDHPERLSALTSIEGRLTAALLEAAAHERGSLILRERGLERRARFESALSRLKLAGTGAMLLGLFAAFIGLVAKPAPEVLPLDRLADPSLSAAGGELPLLALLAGFAVSLIARVGARIVQPRLHAELAAYAQLINLFELRELEREKARALR